MKVSLSTRKNSKIAKPSFSSLHVSINEPVTGNNNEVCKVFIFLCENPADDDQTVINSSKES